MIWEDVNDWRQESGPWAIVCGLVHGSRRFVVYRNDRIMAGGFTSPRNAKQAAERMAMDDKLLALTQP